MTPEEHARLRWHRITASRAADLLTESYRVWNRLARDMRAENPRPIGKRCGVPSLDWGMEHEPWVRATLWEAYPEWSIEPVEFQTYHLPHPLLTDHVGASPDGRIFPEGFGYEGKAPLLPEIHEHYRTLHTAPEEYLPQIQWGLWVTGWPGWVFASGDPRREDEGRLTVRYVIPDPKMHERFEELSIRFLESYLSGEVFQPIKPTAKTFNEMFK